MRRTGRIRSWSRVVAAVAARPDLWRTAAAQGARLARPGWWHRPPFLPLPDRAYLRFRLVTAEGGDGDGVPSAEDVTAYLAWCRGYPRVGHR